MLRFIGDFAAILPFAFTRALSMGAGQAVQFDSVDDLYWSVRNSKKTCAWLAGLYLLRKSFRLGSVVLSAFPWICLMSDLHPAIELLNHTSMHVFIAVSIVMPVAFVLREYFAALPLALAFALLSFQVQPLSLILGPPDSEATYDNQVKVICWNMLATNENFDGLQSLLEEHTPDVLVLIELRPGVIERTGYLLDHYPRYRYRPSWGGEGIGIFAKEGVASFDFEQFGFEKQPALIANVNGAGDRTLKLVGMHTLSPLPLDRVATRDLQLAELARWAQSVDEPIAVCGDFNISPWTTPFKNLLRSGFRDSRHGVGNEASWPAELGILGVPIDHVLARGQCEVTNRKVLGQVEGSDHQPVYFEVNF